MSAQTVIRSAANPLVKLARSAVAGKEHDLLVLEGDRLVDDARASGLALRHVLVDEQREGRAAELEATGFAVARVESALLGRISGLVTSPGILALAVPPKSAPLERICAGAAALVLVVDGLQNPGNLGALARSAEAAGAAGLAIVAGSASPWSAKALRGSMGSLVRLSVHVAQDAAALARELEQRGVRSFTAATRGGAPLGEFDFGGRIAFWIGSETGAREFPDAVRERVTIPMAGGVESLNVTVAASLVLFAAGRVAAPGAGR